MKKFLLVVVVLLGIGGIGLLLAANQGYFGYSLGNTNGLKARLNQTLGSSGAISTNVNRIEEHSVCQTVTSTDSRDLFIPTKTTGERATFRTKKPSHITLGPCGCTTDADCGTLICSGYIPPTANVCKGTYNTLGWRLNDSELNNDIQKEEEHGCVKNITVDPSNYSSTNKPTYLPTTVGQIGGIMTVDREGEFWINCNYFNNGVGGSVSVRWEGYVVSTSSCSPLNQTSCQTINGCDWTPGTPDTLGTCVVGGCTTTADCSAGKVCSGYVPGAGYCEGGQFDYTYTSPGYCKSACHSTYCEQNCGSLTTEYTCLLPVQYSNYGFDEAPSCARVPGQTTTQNAYCGQEFQYKSECDAAPSPCYWAGGAASPGTCITQTCGTANGKTYTSLNGSSANLCNIGSASNFTALTSSWTWKCGTASCSAIKANNPCTLPRGGTIAHGASVDAYLYESGKICKQQTRTCNNGVLGGSYQYELCDLIGGGCFKEGTQILLTDGKTTNIEKIQIGDIVIGSENQKNTVVKLFKIWRNDWDMYSINGSDYFFTDTHPFMTLEGWKSMNPVGTLIENPDMIVSRLEIGDILIKKEGLERIYNTDRIIKQGYVYNFKLDGDHTYYADGYLVHNPVEKQER